MNLKFCNHRLDSLELLFGQFYWFIANLVHKAFMILTDINRIFSFSKAFGHGVARKDVKSEPELLSKDCRSDNLTHFRWHNSGVTRLPEFVCCKSYGIRRFASLRTPSPCSFTSSKISHLPRKNLKSKKWIFYKFSFMRFINKRGIFFQLKSIHYEAISLKRDCC